MAVIDTSMDMPKGCLKCEYHDDIVGFCRKIKRYTNACFSETDKNPHCPLKSADEMMEELKRYETLMFHEDGSPMGAFIHAQMVKEIVGRYCDKERKDG